VLVHNASDLGPVPLRPLLDTAPEDFTRALEVNLLGPFRLSQAVVGSMVLRGQGLVLHVTSDAGVEAYPGWGAYGASKAALDHMARIWAAELADTGVRILSVDPGEMRTRMHADAMPDADPATLVDPADVAESLLELVRDAESLRSGSRVEAVRFAPSARR
jgi:NAD(P)-dependent dehydrogenase (short-subunit alcohol dehydrogenase family)